MLDFQHYILHIASFLSEAFLKASDKVAGAAALLPRYYAPLRSPVFKLGCILSDSSGRPMIPAITFFPVIKMSLPTTGIPKPLSA